VVGSVRVLSQDILAGKTDLNTLGPARRTYAQPGFMACIIAPTLLWVTLNFVAQRRRRLQTDTAYYRRTHAQARMHERLRRAAKALRRGDGKQFYTMLSDALCHFIADRLDLAAPQLSAQSLPTLLDGTGATPDALSEITRLLHRCDFGRFATNSFDAAEAQQLLQCTELVLKQLSRELR
jgi:hypothetical protein